MSEKLEIGKSKSVVMNGIKIEKVGNVGKCENPKDIVMDRVKVGKVGESREFQN